MFEVIVPMLPPNECSPNWRGHWSKRMRASRAYKEAVYYCSCGEPRPEKPYLYAVLEVICVVAQCRVRDADNFAARFKPGQDALVLADVRAFDDTAHLQVLPIKFVKDKSLAPATIIKVWQGKPK